MLLLVMKVNVEDRGLKDMTPLMEASNTGHLEIVKLLIQYGADINAQTSQEKKLKGTKVKNQDVNVKSQQELHGTTLPSIVCPEGNTPLMFACAAGHEKIVRVLLDAGTRVEDHNENGHTPLMEAASVGHVGVARLLVERGASINTHSMNSRRVLSHWLATKKQIHAIGNAEMVNVSQMNSASSEGIHIPVLADTGNWQRMVILANLMMHS